MGNQGMRESTEEEGFTPPLLGSAALELRQIQAAILQAGAGAPAGTVVHAVQGGAQQAKEPGSSADGLQGTLGFGAQEGLLGGGGFISGGVGVGVGGGGSEQTINRHGNTPMGLGRREHKEAQGIISCTILIPGRFLKIENDLAFTSIPDGESRGHHNDSDCNLF